MFPQVTQTWNPVTGCKHDCSYCYARRLAEGRLHHLPRYRDSFNPRLVEDELRHRFHFGLVFVSNMGDLFGSWVPREWIEAVLQVIRESPNATFLLLTKNPQRYQEFDLPPNAIAGATIETHSYFFAQFQMQASCCSHYSQAPFNSLRFRALRDLRHPLKFISIEPIMDFEMERMVGWIQEIAPEFVYVGYDNWNHHLPEPTLAKTQELIQRLVQFTVVWVKTLREPWWKEAT